MRGTEVEVKVAGADLEGVKWMNFSHDALKAEPKKNEDGEIVANVFLLKVAGDAPLVSTRLGSAAVNSGRRTTVLLSLEICP